MRSTAASARTTGDKRDGGESQAWVEIEIKEVPPCSARVDTEAKEQARLAGCGSHLAGFRAGRLR